MSLSGSGHRSCHSRRLARQGQLLTTGGRPSDEIAVLGWQVVQIKVQSIAALFAQTDVPSPMDPAARTLRERNKVCPSTRIIQAIDPKDE